MAYTNETTHFGFPLPLGTDLTVPMDYNESLEAADASLFEAQTNAAGAVGTAGNALTVANEAKTEAQSATATANSATATANAAATAANEAVAAVAEAKDDALDMICAVVEETATAQYKHEPTKGGLNYYFRYNDILYKTTAVINVGETIVPNTNCAATNVATEIAQIESESPETLVYKATADGTKTWAQLLTEIDNNFSGDLNYNAKIVVYSTSSNSETIYPIISTNGIFGFSLVGASDWNINALDINNHTFKKCVSGTLEDSSSQAPASGYTVSLYN